MKHHDKNPASDPNDDLEKDADDGALDEEEDSPVPIAGSNPDFYQQQMHIENGKRLSGLEKSHGTMLRILGRIEANTKDLPRLREDVDELKENRANVKGAMWIVMAGAPLLSWLAAKFGKI